MGFWCHLKSLLLKVGRKKYYSLSLILKSRSCLHSAVSKNCLTISGSFANIYFMLLQLTSLLLQFRWLKTVFKRSLKIQQQITVTICLIINIQDMMLTAWTDPSHTLGKKLLQLHVKTDPNLIHLEINPAGFKKKPKSQVHLFWITF